MKNFAITLCLLLLTCSVTVGQTCITFQEMERQGLPMDSLDSTYPNALHPDTAQGPFMGRQKNFEKAWGQFYEDLIQHFHDHGLEWENPTYCFNKIYFSPTGEIEYWFFNFRKKDAIPADKQAQFLKLIKEFSRSYQIKITADTNFSQCTSVTLFNLDDLRR